MGRGSGADGGVKPELLVAGLNMERSDGRVPLG